MKVRNLPECWAWAKAWLFEEALPLWGGVGLDPSGGFLDQIDDARRPAPGEYEPQKFSWEAHAADYQYFVVRNAPLGFSDYLTDHGCEPVMHSGPWGVFRRGWE